MIMKNEIDEVMDALKYFYVQDMIENTHGDQRHYIEVLIHFAADTLKVGLE
jgi:hypothetical protein